MKIIIFEKDSGKIIFCIKDKDDNFLNNVLSNTDYLEVDEDFVLEGSWVDVKNLSIINYGKRPIGCYKLTSIGWELDLESTIISETTEVRTKRNQLLAESDWTDNLSAKTRLGEEKYSQWQNYRQALRDITNQSGFPLNVVFPEKPEV